MWKMYINQKLVFFFIAVICFANFSATEGGNAKKTIDQKLVPHFNPTSITSKKEKPKPINFLTKEILPKPKPLIVIDAGHGGDDFGTHSLTAPGYQEKFLNLTTALMLQECLNKMGYLTSMTRRNDVFIPLIKRAEIANELSPKIFVSVHYNSAPSKKAEGIEVFYYRSTEDKVRTDDSKILAEYILKQVIKTTAAKSRGVKSANFAVIRHTKMPAILIEGGFLTNDEEMVKLKDSAYLKKIAQGIAKGIDEYIVKTE